MDHTGNDVNELEAEIMRLRAALDAARVALLATEQLVVWALGQMSVIEE